MQNVATSPKMNQGLTSPKLSRTQHLLHAFIFVAFAETHLASKWTHLVCSDSFCFGVFSVKRNLTTGKSYKYSCPDSKKFTENLGCQIVKQNGN